MILHHISTDLSHNGVFTPRVPSIRHTDFEDATTARVSASPNIEQCLSAIPNGGCRLDMLHQEQRGYFKVFRVDTEKLGIDHAVITPEEIYEKGLVADVEVTKEHWITESFVVPAEDIFYILLEEWEEAVADLYPQSIFKVAEEEYGGDIVTAYCETHHSDVPFVIYISSIEYHTHLVKEKQSFTLLVDNEAEEEELAEYMVGKATLLNRDFTCLTYVCDEPMDISPMMIKHLELV